MKYLRATTVPSLPMVRLGQEKHIQWKEERGKRFVVLSKSQNLCVAGTVLSVADYLASFCRMGNFLVMQV